MEARRTTSLSRPESARRCLTTTAFSWKEVQAAFHPIQERGPRDARVIRGAQALQERASTAEECATSADWTSLWAELRPTPVASSVASAGSPFGHAVIAVVGWRACESDRTVDATEKKAEQSTYAEGAQLPDHETRQWGPGAVVFAALEEARQMLADDLVEDGVLGLVVDSLPWHTCRWRGRRWRLPVRLRIPFCGRGIPGPGRGVLRSRF